MSKFNQYVKHKRDYVGNGFVQEHIPLGNPMSMVLIYLGNLNWYLFQMLFDPNFWTTKSVPQWSYPNHGESLEIMESHYIVRFRPLKIIRHYFHPKKSFFPLAVSFWTLCSSINKYYYQEHKILPSVQLIYSVEPYTEIGSVNIKMVIYSSWAT